MAVLRRPAHDRRRVRPLGRSGGDASGLAAAHTAWYFGLNVWVGVLAALVFSLSIGAFNGWLLHKTGLPSFLVTLGTFFVLQGVNLAVTRLVTGGVSSNTISDMDGFGRAPGGLRLEHRHRPGRHQDPGPLLDRAHGIASWVLLRTRVGNWIFAVGGDSAAARAVGVPVVATKVGLFMAVGFGAWLLRDAPALRVQQRAVRSGRRQRVHLHHRGRHRRLPAHRRLRLDRRCGDRRADLSA